MSDEMVIRTLRAQSWMRAKGELQALLSTYWSHRYNTPEQFDRISALVGEFTKTVDGDGLAE